MLERTGRVIGHAQPGRARCRQPHFVQKLADIAGERCDPIRLGCIDRIIAQHEAIILDRRAAAGCRDDDCCQPAVLDLPRPGINITPGGFEGGFLAAHMMYQCATAAFTRREDHVVPTAIDEAHRSRAKFRAQRWFGTALEDCHPAFALGGG